MAITTRRRAGAAAALVAVAVAAFALSRTASATPTATEVATAPTAEAAVRTLSTTAELEGTVERVDARTIAHGGVVSTAVTSAEAEEPTAPNLPVGVAVARGKSAGAVAAKTQTAGPEPTATAEPLPEPTASEPTASEPTASEPTEPAPTAAPSPTASSDEPSPSDEPAPTDEAAPTDEPSPTDEPEPTETATEEPCVVATEPWQTPTTEPTPEPTTSPTSATEEPAADAPSEAPAGDPAACPEQDPSSPVPPLGGGGGGARPSGGGGGGGGATPGSAPVGGAATGETAAADATVLTSLVPIGATVDRGTVIYGADLEPVVAVLGTTPAYRTLEDGVDDGPDVRQLEENLAALGYGGDLTVDDAFDGATADAVEAWETDLGRLDPDGVAEPSEIVVLTEGGTVIRQDEVVGELISDGTDVVTIGAEAQQVEVEVPADEAADWPVGTPVELLFDGVADGTGTVAEIGRRVTGGSTDEPGTVLLTVTLDDPDTARPDGTNVTIAATTASVDAAVAVPVAAILDGPDGEPAVRVVTDDGDRFASVTTGLVDNGWVEVTDGLEAGQTVRLPG